MTISICMTSYNRPTQLNNTLLSIVRQNVTDLEIIVVDDGTDNQTESICQTHGVKYFKLNRPPSSEYREVGRPMNVGIRQASGDTLIMQNAECMHIDPDAIRKLTSAVTDSNVVFAKVSSLSPDGSIDSLYCGQQNPRAYFFCGAIKKWRVEKLRGLDEDYPGSGYEDDDFSARLKHDGISFLFSDIDVYHQYHDRAGTLNMGPAYALFVLKCNAMKQGSLGVERNLGREWGVL